MYHAAKAFLLIAWLASGAVGAEAQAQIVVISHKSSSVESLTMTELGRIYTGDATTFSPVCIQQKLSDRFFEAVLNKSDMAIRKLWVKVMLSGKVPLGPVALASDEEVIEYVRTHPGAIGFVSLSSVSGAVKVLKIDGADPQARAYPLQGRSPRSDSFRHLQLR